MIRFSGCNPNGNTSQNIRSQLQHSMDLDIGIQCYSEVNANLLKSNLRHKFHEAVSSTDRNSKATWSTSGVPCDSSFKPGGTSGGIDRLEVPFSWPTCVVFEVSKRKSCQGSIVKAKFFEECQRHAQTARKSAVLTRM